MHPLPNKVPYKKIYKLIVIGKERSGKTTLYDSYAYGRFRPNKSKCGIRGDFISMQEEIEGETVTLQVWDTAGQERFQSLGVSFYRGSDIVLVAFDVTNEESFAAVDSWLEEIEAQEITGKGVCVFLLGTKVDLPNRKVSFERASEYARLHHLDYLEVTATNQQSVKRMFQRVAAEKLRYEKYYSPQRSVTPIPPKSTKFGKLLMVLCLTILVTLFLWPPNAWK